MYTELETGKSETKSVDQWMSICPHTHMNMSLLFLVPMAIRLEMLLIFIFIGQWLLAGEMSKQKDDQIACMLAMKKNTWNGNNES